MAANAAMPSTSDPSTRLMITSVMRALRDSGGRKTLTPLEMASVPVSAEPPEANAFITMNTDAPEEQAVARRPDRDRPRMVQRMGVEIPERPP